MSEAEPAHLVICQGPPSCSLQGDAAIEAQRNGCPWCRRELVTERGSHVTADPMATQQ